MHSYLPVLQTSPLFKGFSLSEIQLVLAYFPAGPRQYAKGDTILSSGSFTSQIGVLLSGEVTAHKLSPSGELYTAARFTRGGIFGDLLAAGNTKSPVTLTAHSPCQVLYLDFPTLPAPAHQPLYFRLYANIIQEISNKYFALDKRVDLLLLQGLRKKIAAYLLEASGGDSHSFAIPYSRTGLAHHLGCDRSALSREISRMAKEGLLETQGQVFKIPQPGKLQKLLQG